MQNATPATGEAWLRAGQVSTEKRKQSRERESGAPQQPGNSEAKTKASAKVLAFRPRLLVQEMRAAA